MISVKELEDRALELDRLIRERLPEGVEFAVMLFARVEGADGRKHVVLSGTIEDGDLAQALFRAIQKVREAGVFAPRGGTQ